MFRYEIYYKSMINLQSSKRLIRTYDDIISNGLQPIHQDSFLPLDKLTAKNKSSIPREPSSIDFGKTISKMIKIQFDEHNKPKQSTDIRLKRKLMTTSEKFYNRKKQHYSSYIKETQQRNNNAVSGSNHTFLTIGSHAICKMDYTSANFNQNIKYLQENVEIKRRLKDNFNISDIRSLFLDPNAAGKVLISRKNERQHKFQNTLYPHTQRKNVSSNNNKMVSSETHRLERVLTSKNKQSSQKYISIQEFIPIRKDSNKKEPFIFGLSEKQFNPQKSKDKIVLYQDFLWKINYSNGLYVKPSEIDIIYKFYVGPGNNSNLIKSIIKRRFWWTVSERLEGSNLVWTQLKINCLFKQQKNSQIEMSSLYPSKVIQQAQNLKSEYVVTIQEEHQKIFNNNDLINWNRHMRKYRKTQKLISEKTYKNRLQFLNCKEIVKIDDSSKLVVHNHLQQNYYIGNKKALFYNMKRFYQLQKMNVFDALPLTFHITKGLQDAQFKIFLNKYAQFEQAKKRGEDIKNVWIMKPGENSNRGNGISVCHGIQDIKLRLKGKQKNSDGSLRTFIIQKYIQKPLLYKGRKFDIRHYMLITSFNGIIKAYWFPQGYIRTSSSQFTLKRGTNMYIHLTNDAIQKHSEQYGKYEKGNKISYQKFQNYLNKNSIVSSTTYFFSHILPQMKYLAIQAVKSTFLILDPNKREHNFELLGMDFMIDDRLKPWLIEINTNPCLQLSSPLLMKIIPSLVEQTCRICVDPFFPPPKEWPNNKKIFTGDNVLQQNQFQLIFDESIEGQGLRQLFKNSMGVDSKMGKIEQDDQVFENDGVEQWMQKKE